MKQHNLPVFSSKELISIANAIKMKHKEVEVSFDLGLTKTKLKIAEDGFYFNGKIIKIPKVRPDKCCFVIIDDEVKKLQFFGEDTQKLYKLIPTSFRPILHICATSMHKKDFLDRIEADGLKGNILDSGTGLGYSAIIAAKTADKVITIEVDPNVIEMAKYNPYSRELFENKKIKLEIGDICETIIEFKDSEFDNIIFDAGTPRSSGDFFSQKNYIQAYRVLKKDGKLYHYLPKHQITRGRDFGQEVINRLDKAGFKKIERKKEESYVVAEKA